jgi:hypothetical protein
MAISRRLAPDAEIVISGRQDPLLMNGGVVAKSVSIAFLADFEKAWREHGKGVLDRLAEKHPQAFFNGAVALARVIKWETEQDVFSGGMTPDEVMDKLEERAGPEARKLFEKFLRQLNALHAKQLAAQEEETG